MNVLYKYTTQINEKSDVNTITALLSNLTNDTHIYSYLIKKINDYYKCQFIVCSKKEYNTINVIHAISECIFAISSNKSVAFKQPPLEIMIEQFQPFVHSLAREQHIHWQYLEYDDLVQMCYLSMIRLYRQGYYLHASLLRTTYIRDVLLHIRKNKTDYELVSLYNAFGHDDSLMTVDTIEDTNYTNMMLDKEDDDATQSLFKTVKQLIIDIIGDRRFEQLFREYATKNTTGTGRQVIVQLRRKLNNTNIINKLKGDRYEKTI